MDHGLAHHKLEIRRFAFFLGVFLVASSAGPVRVHGMPHPPATGQAKKAKEKETTMRGCLGGRPKDGVYYLVADDGGYFYFLTGNTSLLRNYVGKEVGLRGKETDAVAPPGFEVTGIGRVFDTPCPTFKPAFGGGAWRTERNRKYGVEFSYPEDFTRTARAELGNPGGNFVTGQGVASVAQLAIPRGVYANSNFVGGTFAVLVNTEIGNGPSCRHFGFSDPRFGSSHTFDGIHYSELARGSAAGPTSYGDYQFHTFQNDLCYEISFEFAEEGPGYVEHKFRALRDRDKWNLIRDLIAHVHFSTPTVAVARKGSPQAVPKVTRFVASSHTADDVNNRGQITFSWTTRHADYVELSYRCFPPMAGGIPAAVILDGGYPDTCENAGSSFQSTTVQYRAANSSHTILLGDNRRQDPVTVVVKLTPFAYGRAYPDSAKSISIRVDPSNPSR